MIALPDSRIREDANDAGILFIATAALLFVHPSLEIESAIDVSLNLVTFRDDHEAVTTTSSS